MFADPLVDLACEVHIEVARSPRLSLLHENTIPDHLVDGVAPAGATSRDPLVTAALRAAPVSCEGKPWISVSICM